MSAHAVAGRVLAFRRSGIFALRRSISKNLQAAALAIAMAGALAASPAAAGAGATRLQSAPALRPVAVFGSDDRVGVPAQYRELQDRVGLLFNLRSRTVCTAFCVARDIIATAGHCLHGAGGAQAPRLADFWFAPHFEARQGYGRFAGSANGTVAQFVMSGALSLNVKPPIDATKDWALVRLAQNACKGVFPIRAMPTEQVLAEAAAGRVFQLAYHRDYTPWRLAYSKPCEVSRNFPGADWATISKDFVDPGQLLLHTCDTGGASSGSPILLDTPTGPEVIGINVGTYVQSKVEVENGQVIRRSKSDTVANTAVSALAFAPKLDVLRQAVILTAPAQIRALQAALRQRGHYAAESDGRFSAGLRLAIEAYERAQGLPVTGLATQALLKRLTSAAARPLPLSPVPPAPG